MVYILKIEREDGLEGEREDRVGHLTEVEQEKEEERGWTLKKGSLIIRGRE